MHPFMPLDPNRTDFPWQVELRYMKKVDFYRRSVLESIFFKVKMLKVSDASPLREAEDLG